jgi:hypothetical protein
MFPIQPGGRDVDGNEIFAVASTCNESTKLVKAMYIKIWELRHSFERIINRSK